MAQGHPGRVGYRPLIGKVRGAMTWGRFGDPSRPLPR
jgi:hypothetical protein